MAAEQPRETGASRVTTRSSFATGLVQPGELVVSIQLLTLGTSDLPLVVIEPGATRNQIRHAQSMRGTSPRCHA